MSLLLVQKSLYVCTGCGWFGTARALGLKARTKGSTSSNNHASRRPDCPHGPCLVLERTPGQSRKQDAAAYLARCTREVRALGMPPTGGCPPCMPTPEGRQDGNQWVAVQIPEGVEPGESFEHLNHNGRYMMTVTVPEGAKAGETLGTPSGNKRRRSAREMQARAERQAATVERATAERDAAEIAADEQAAGGGGGNEGGGGGVEGGGCEGEGGGGESEGEGVEGGGGEDEGEDEGVAAGVGSNPSATPSITLTAAAALVPAADSPVAAPDALVPAARTALVAEAERAKVAAVAEAAGKKAKAKAGSAAVCQVLRDALQRVDDPRDLLDPVACPRAVSTAQRTYHELMTGKPPSSARAILLAADGAPWPSDQPAPPEGYGLWALGLNGSDPVESALAQFISRYAAQAIVRRLHRSDAPLVIFKAANGDQKGRLCLLMCVTSYLNQLHPSSLLHSVLISQERRRLEGHPAGGDGHGRDGARAGGDRARAGRRRVGR